MRIAIVCGGPSAERGISLNSARSLLDHLSPQGWEIVPLYCDMQRRFFRLSTAQLYSNTPSDFDFKLAQSAYALTKEEFIRECRAADLVFPAIHGAFGEDGALQTLLEKNGIPFIGSPASTCTRMFDKASANTHLSRHGFATLPNCTFSAEDKPEDIVARAGAFFRRHHLTQAVVKPTAGGSSLGVATVTSAAEAAEKARLLFEQKRDTSAIIEPYCDGQEFTVLVLQAPDGKPVALIPTEIRLEGKESEIFSFRHKYLPNCHVSYHCPPRFSDEIIAAIQKSAEILFVFFGMRDFARLDGWLLPEGGVVFSDFNPISGMEQNSFLFHQASRIGFSHAEILRYIVMQAGRRAGITFSQKEAVPRGPRRPVHVLFGGATAERQVSLMSGTNVWLKLLHSAHYAPDPYLLASNGEVWRLPYPFTLNHTVEEIALHCQSAGETIQRLQKLVPPIRARLGLDPNAMPQAMPQRMSLEQFCQEAKAKDAFVFLGLHGGAGEDGTIQAMLDSFGLDYNGSGQTTSRLCMNKEETGKIINALNDPGLIAAPKISFRLEEALRNPKGFFARACEELNSTDLIIKPQDNGCSAGVARIQTVTDFSAYMRALQNGLSMLSPHSLAQQPNIIELPAAPRQLLLEPFIATDETLVDGATLIHHRRKGWIEMTVGVLEEAGRIHSFLPSITVAKNSVLSLEEKFQGGTGINLTPPPGSIVNTRQIALIQARIAEAAEALGIENYARIDIFFNMETDQVLVIEANSLPGLTASTVIFHQALAENPPLAPGAFIEKLIVLKSRQTQDVPPLSQRCS